MIDHIVQDLRFGGRLLRRAPGFTAAAVLAIALGVGATTAVFTILDRVVLRPLPYPEPDRLVMTWETNDTKALPHERLSPVNFMDYRALPSFEDATAWWYPQLTLTEAGHDPLRVNAVEASANFFAVLGVQPALGAGFPAAPFYDRDAIIVISDRLWRDRFGRDPGIVGRAVALNGPLMTVVGVMPPGFNFPGDTDVWQRLTWDLKQHSRGAHFMESVFRLRRGATIASANADLRALTARLARENPSTNEAWSARAVALGDEVVGFFRPALYALFGAAGFLLLITCTNVASLLLARATVREREVAVRAAIGASRGRLVRQFLAESVLLAALGTILGVAVAVVVSKAFVARSPIPLPRVTDVGIDGRLLLFGTALAAITSLAFGVVPALLTARGDIQRPLKEAGRGEAAGRTRARGLLVVAEVGVSVMLLVGAALFARSFARLVSQDPGFRPAAAVTAKVELPYSYTDWTRIVAFYDRLLSSVRSEPAVAVAGAANFLPLDAAWRGPYFIQGRPRPRSGDESQAQHQTVDEDYFRAIGVPLVRGRFFDARDTATAPGVVIINETMARRQWRGEDPIGASLVTPVRVIGPLGRMIVPEGVTFQVIGIVADVRNASLTRDAEPAIYFSFRQFPFRGLNIVARGRDSAAGVIAAIRGAVQRLDPNLAVVDARSLDSIVGDQIDRPRGLMMLMAVFAAIALALAALGIYSVMSYGVNQRRQEISVRMALGAQPNQVVWMIVRQGVVLAVAGGVAGTIGALALGRTVSTLLFGVAPTDIAAFGIAFATAVVAATAACLIPARRAASMDPLEGLRQ